MTHSRWGCARWGCALAVLVSACGSRSELEAPDVSPVTQTVPPPADGHVVGMALGAGWSWALIDDGTTWFWGTADGWTSSAGASRPPAPTESPAGIASLGVGRDQVCAVLHGGTLECWGEDNEGQAGTSSPNGDPTFVPPTVTATGISSVSVGDVYGCAVRTDGVALCWGPGSSPQIGVVSGDGEPAPTPVQGIQDVQSISAKQAITCAVVTGGEVMCWGAAPLGDGSAAPSSSATPVRVQGLDGAVTQVAVGGSHACALLADKTVMCWGPGDHGQLGLGAGVMSALLPRRVPGLANVRAVSSGTYHSCALLDDGTAQCWGTYGAPPVADTWSPTVVQGLAGAKEIASGSNHDCAILEDRTMVCWGDDGSGELGPTPSRTGEAGHPTPVAVPGLP